MKYFWSREVRKIDIKELNRAKRNEKVKDFINFVLKECEARNFSIADMKDLAALIPNKIGKAIITNDERVKFKT